jgi:hypothetical protein
LHPTGAYQWTTKVAGRTVTRRLNEREAALYEEQIANGRQLRHLIAEMRKVADEARKLILAVEQPQTQ